MRIAICGGIGSGKSAVLDIIRGLGYSVVSADDITRELYKDEKFVRLVAAAFPEAVIDGELDKATLSEIIFKDKAKRLVLNSISHPMIINRIMAIDCDPLFVEVPLLIESGLKEQFDEIIYVKSKLRHRIKRLKETRGLSTKQIRAVMKAQARSREVAEVATVILNNFGGIDELKENVVEIIDYILKDKP